MIFIQGDGSCQNEGHYSRSPGKQRQRERERKIERNPAHYKRHTSQDGSPGQWILYKDQRILKRSIPSIVSQLQLHACVSLQSSGVFKRKNKVNRLIATVNQKQLATD